MTSLATLVVFLHASSAELADPRALYEQLCSQVAAAYDSSQGGFITKKGLPVESAVELALLRARETHDTTWTGRATRTIRWTRGLLDTVAGGFYHAAGRRGSDLDGITKRADSNARRIEVLLQAWSLTGDVGYRADAARTVDFMERVLLDGRGGFVSAQVGDRELEPEANGIAIHAWLAWSAARLDRRQRDFALRSLDRVWETCWQPEFGLVRKDGFGDVTSVPLLADQVEMGRACVLAARLCGRPDDLQRARMLGDLLIARYEEKSPGGFRTSSVPKKNGSIQRASRLPGENARAALFLAELAALSGETRYRDASVRARTAFAKSLDKIGLAAADWALAVRTAFGSELPAAPDWSKAVEPESAPRKRSVTFKLGRY